jgi:FkbM family methyltransferase
MKQMILGSALGRAALVLRDKFSLIREACAHPERVGTLANDQLATTLITKICRPNRSFVDVGAHIGSIVSEVAHNDPTIRIIAIEAIPEKAEKLRRKFPQVETHNCAVGEYAGEASFFVHLKQSGFSSLGRQSNVRADAIREIKVRVERLDDLVASHEVDAIKIDVEGAELGVLRGSVATLTRCRPIIMFESGPQAEDGLGYTKEAMHQFFVANNFSVILPNRVGHNDEGLTLPGFVESHWYPFRTTNYFAIPSERRIECRDRARSILGIRDE